MKSTALLICLAVGLACLPLACSKSDEQGTDTSPPKPDASDKFIGKVAGQVRDDNGLKMKLVWCPPGKFTMGSPKTESGRAKHEDQVEVTLSQGYWLGKYEVTQSEWKQVMKTEPWKGRDSTIDDLTKVGADFPASYVNWNNAAKFCRILTEQERQSGRLPKDWEYTLPTEAQWERACRAQTEARFSFGDDELKLGDYAWFAANAHDAGEEYAHQVGQKKANPWGLFDMHGNLYEWCHDPYTIKLPGGRDPEAKPDVNTGSPRVFRGGCWFDDAALCRSGYRTGYKPGLGDDYVGFRPALSSAQPLK